MIAGASSAFRSLCVSRAAGVGNAGNTDGKLLSSTFCGPTYALPLDGDTILISDTQNHAIRLLDLASGAASTLSSTSPYGNENLLFHPKGLVKYTHNGIPGILIADSGHHSIKFLNGTTGYIEPFIGGESPGYADGSAGDALFNRPTCIAVSTVSSFIYVTDSGNHCIRYISPVTMRVGTLSGVPGLAGFRDQTKPLYRNPTGLALLPDGNLLLCDTGNSLIRYVSCRNGEAVTLCGRPTPNLHKSACVYNFTNSLYNNKLLMRHKSDASYADIILQEPEGIFVHSDSRIVIADTGNNRLLLMDPSFNSVICLSSSKEAGDSEDLTPLQRSQFNRPIGICALRDVLYVVDNGGNRIRRLHECPEPQVMDSTMVAMSAQREHTRIGFNVDYSSTQMHGSVTDMYAGVHPVDMQRKKAPLNGAIVPPVEESSSIRGLPYVSSGADASSIVRGAPGYQIGQKQGYPTSRDNGAVSGGLDRSLHAKSLVGPSDTSAACPEPLFVYDSFGPGNDYHHPTKNPTYNPMVNTVLYQGGKYVTLTSDGRHIPLSGQFVNGIFVGPNKYKRISSDTDTHSRMTLNTSQNIPLVSEQSVSSSTHCHDSTVIETNLDAIELSTCAGNDPPAVPSVESTQLSETHGSMDSLFDDTPTGHSLRFEMYNTLLQYFTSKANVRISEKGSVTINESVPAANRRASGVVPTKNSGASKSALSGIAPTSIPFSRSENLALPDFIGVLTVLASRMYDTSQPTFSEFGRKLGKLIQTFSPLLMCSTIKMDTEQPLIDTSSAGILRALTMATNRLSYSCTLLSTDGLASNYFTTSALGKQRVVVLVPKSDTVTLVFTFGMLVDLSFVRCFNCTSIEIRSVFSQDPAGSRPPFSVDTSLDTKDEIDTTEDTATSMACHSIGPEGPLLDEQIVSCTDLDEATSGLFDMSEFHKVVCASFNIETAFPPDKGAQNASPQSEFLRAINPKMFEKRYGINISDSPCYEAVVTAQAIGKRIKNGEACDSICLTERLEVIIPIIVAKTEFHYESTEKKLQEVLNFSGLSRNTKSIYRQVLFGTMASKSESVTFRDAIKTRLLSREETLSENQEVIK